MKKILMLLGIGFILIGCSTKKLTYRELSTIDDTKTITPKKNGKLHGIVKSYYKGKGIAMTQSYINGKKDGQSTKYWYSEKESSTPKIDWTAHFINNKLDGQYISYFREGQIESKSNYKNGLLHGTFKRYSSDGMLSEEIHYNNGKKHGKEIIYYYAGRGECKAGQIKTISNYKNGLLHGKVTSFYCNGKKEEEKSFNNGNKNGKWIGYYPNNQISYQANYKNGKKLLYISYYRDGRISGDSRNYKEAISKPLIKHSNNKFPIQLKCKNSFNSSSLSISEFSHEKAKATGRGKGSALGYLKNHRQPSKINAYQYCTEEANSKIRVENTTCSMAKIFRASCMNGFGY